ncbi:bifunctional AP-4-A phosphorylase/ADP sulfurylase, partial [Ceratobasidium sp. 423]
MSYLKHSEVISSVHSKFEAAKASGALFFYPSTRSRATERGFNFEITICPALQKKPTLPAPEFTKVDKPDPFAPPYIPDLFVGDLKDELDGDEYVILLNKFSVIQGHFLMVTKGFQPHNSPLTPPDLTQAYLLIRASQKSKSPVFAIYNCGADSGASQPHKHIQFLPTTRDEVDEDEDEEDDSWPPVEAYIQRLKLEDDTKLFSLPLPYAHFVQKLQLPKATVSGTKPLSKEALGELSGKLTNTFLNLLDEAIQTIRLYHSSKTSTTGPAETSRASAPSYNIILTSEHMHLIPRLRERTLEELHPDGAGKTETEAAYTPQKLSVNSLGFAGMLLAKSDAEARAIKARGVVELLSQ